MSQLVVVTVSYGNQHSLDLALPYDIPSQVVARGVARVMGLPLDREGQQRYVFVHSRTEEKRPILPHETLADARVSYGDYLEIVPEETSPGFLRPESGEVYLQLGNGKIIPVTKSPLRLGRNSPGVHVDVDLTDLDDARVVSRQHATLTVREGKFYLQDNRSRNGTHVNGKKLQRGETRELHTEDIIRLGGPRGVELTFIVRP